MLDGSHGCGRGQGRASLVADQGPVLGCNKLRYLGVDPCHQFIVLPVRGDVPEGERGLGAIPARPDTGVTEAPPYCSRWAWSRLRSPSHPTRSQSPTLGGPGPPVPPHAALFASTGTGETQA